MHDFFVFAFSDCEDLLRDEVLRYKERHLFADIGPVGNGKYELPIVVERFDHFCEHGLIERRESLWVMFCIEAVGGIADDEVTLMGLVAAERHCVSIDDQTGSRRYGWLESAHRALDELTKEALGEALGAITSEPLDQYLQSPVVFELQGLGDDQKRCVCLYLLQYVLLLRKHQTDEREILRHVLVFDEAHNVFPKDQWGELGIPSRLAREVREYGEAIISATQQADVADSIIANSGTKIVLRTDYPKDAELASKLLQVDTKWISKIPMGQAIIRLPTRYYQACLIAFDEQPIKNQTVTDAMVQERSTQSHQEDDESSTPQPASPEQALDEMSTRERALLADIALHPVSTITERYHRLSWNPKTGNAVKDKLLSEGLISFVVLPVLQSRVKLLALTALGETRARAEGIALRSSGRAGLEHEFWRARIAERCTTRGYTVTHEHSLGGGKRVDLLVTKGTGRCFIEIETGNSDFQANIAKCQGTPLILFCTTKQSFDAITEIPAGIVCLSPETLNDLPVQLRRFTNHRPLDR